MSSMTIGADAAAERDRELERLVRAAQRGDQLAMSELMDLLAPYDRRPRGGPDRAARASPHRR
jgi:hypothetical protein